MKENEEIQLAIEVFPDFDNDTSRIAADLSRDLGETAKVKLTVNETPRVVTRGLGPELALQIISVAFAGIGTLVQLAKFLKDIGEKKKSNTLIITNPKTGNTVKLSAGDSLEKIEKKMRRVLKKERIKMTFKKK